MACGQDQFRDWLRRRGFTQADASRYLAFDEPYISGLLNGKRTPGLANAIHLERLTGIPVEAWASNEVDESLPETAQTGKKRQPSQGENA